MKQAKVGFYKLLLLNIHLVAWLSNVVVAGLVLLVLLKLAIDPHVARVKSFVVAERGIHGLLVHANILRAHHLGVVILDRIEGIKRLLGVVRGHLINVLLFIHVFLGQVHHSKHVILLRQAVEGGHCAYIRVTQVLIELVKGRQLQTQLVG